MNILNLKNVTKQYYGFNDVALDTINYQINKGDFIILLGGNGSGKSTLLKLLHREQSTTSGHIYFLNKDIINFSQQELSTKIGILTQNPGDSLFTTLTIYENYLLATSPGFFINHQQQRQQLTQYLMDYNPNLANKLDNLVNDLSGGEKQALALALTLSKSPELLLLDEHTSALDPKTAKQIMQLTQKIIQQKHITCVLTTHDLDIALHYGNRVLMLQTGHIHKMFNNTDKAFLTKDTLLQHYR
jgi:putative ABC transport system ATP-binding protein